MRAKITSLLTAIILLVVMYMPVNAQDDPLPAPDWIQITINSDYSKTVTITTPSYMADVVNYYEYSTDSGLSWEKISDPAGGELVFDTTTEFSLRYIYSGFRSTVFTETIKIEKNTTITSDAGITLVIPFDSLLPTDVSLSAYEIVSGADYNAASKYFGESKRFKLFDVHIMRNNKVFTDETVKTWLMPVDSFDIQCCMVYYISDDGEFTPIESQQEINVLLVSTEKTGLFAVVEDTVYRKGDVNGDGLVTASDARLVLRNSAGIEKLTGDALSAADYNSDSSVTAADARLIIRFSAQIDKTN